MERKIDVKEHLHDDKKKIPIFCILYLNGKILSNSYMGTGQTLKEVEKMTLDSFVEKGILNKIEDKFIKGEL